MGEYGASQRADTGESTVPHKEWMQERVRYHTKSGCRREHSTTQRVDAGESMVHHNEGTQERVRCLTNLSEAKLSDKDLGWLAISFVTGSFLLNLHPASEALVTSALSISQLVSL